jgi:hypothetical protein
MTARTFRQRLRPMEGLVPTGNGPTEYGPSFVSSLDSRLEGRLSGHRANAGPSSRRTNGSTNRLHATWPAIWKAKPAPCAPCMPPGCNQGSSAATNRCRIGRIKGPNAVSTPSSWPQMEWVDWYNNRRLFEAIGDIPPTESEATTTAQQRHHLKNYRWQNSASTKHRAVHYGGAWISIPAGEKDVVPDWR